MANPKLFYSEGVNYTKGADLVLNIPIGAVGAPGTPTVVNGFAATPLVRTGAGLYTCSLREPWALMPYWSILTIGAIGAGGLFGQVTSIANLATLGTFTFSMIPAASATPTDPANGQILQIVLGLKNNANLP